MQKVDPPTSNPSSDPATILDLPVSGIPSRTFPLQDGRRGLRYVVYTVAETHTPEAF